jgi:hypothetical protein
MAVDRWMLTWGMALGTISWLILWNVNNVYALLFVGEDHLVEWLQFFCLFLAGIYFGLAVLKEVGVLRFFYILTTLCSFFLAMEEISWGQRLFNIETPKTLEAINTQNEINIHNLESVQRYRHWYLGGVGFLGLAATFIRLSFFQPIKPDRFLRFAFTLTVVSALVMEYGNSLFGRVPIEQARDVRFYAGRFSELGELAFAMAILSYARLQTVRDGIKTH